jgi:hypothetical protein
MLKTHLAFYLVFLFFCQTKVLIYYLLFSLNSYDQLIEVVDSQNLKTNKFSAIKYVYLIIYYICI